MFDNMAASGGGRGSVRRAARLIDAGWWPRMRARAGDRWFVPAAVLVAAGCFVVSVWNTWNVPFEGDEAATLAVIRMPWGRLMSFAWTRTDAVHVVFYGVAKAWAGVFGQSELGMRSLVCLALSAAVFVTVMVGRELRGPLTGLVAGVLLVFMPRAVWGTLLARSYTLSMLLAVSMVWVLLVAVRRGRWGWWLAWAGVCAVCVWVYAYSLLLVPVEVLYAWGRRAKPARALMAGGVVVVSSLPLAWVVFAQGRSAWFAGRPVGWSKTMIEPFFVSVDTAGVLGWVLVAGGLAGLAWSGLRGDRPWPDRLRDLCGNPLGLTAGLVVVPLAGLRVVDWWWFPVFYPNYLPYCVPAFALALALAGAAMKDRPLAIVALAVIVVLTLPWMASQKTYGSTHRGTGWGPTRDLVTAQALPGDCLVTSQAGPRVRNPSRGVLVYRADYARLRDLSLVQVSQDADSFYDTRRPVADAVAGKPCARLWFIAPADQTVDGPLDAKSRLLREQEQDQIAEHGYTLMRSWDVTATQIQLYEDKDK